MARYVVVRNSDQIIDNVVDWDGGPQWAPPVGKTAHLTGLGQITWNWNAGAPFDPNPPPVPVDARDDGARGLLLRRIAELEASPSIVNQIAALKLRLELLGG